MGGGGELKQNKTKTNGRKAVEFLLVIGKLKVHLDGMLTKVQDLPLAFRLLANFGWRSVLRTEASAVARIKGND